MDRNERLFLYAIAAAIIFLLIVKAWPAMQAYQNYWDNAREQGIAPKHEGGESAWRKDDIQAAKRKGESSPDSGSREADVSSSLPSGSGNGVDAANPSIPTGSPL